MESTTPQLVMPSLVVPSRRPFSDIGRSLGNLRLLVAGQAGIGKTSLIRSISEICQHIVYVDCTDAYSSTSVTEIYASTRPYPWWRAELEPVINTSAEYKHPVDESIDRNICFADCSPHQFRANCIEYVESLLMRLCDQSTGDIDLYQLIGSGAEPVVHAVLYMLPHNGPSSADIRRIFKHCPM
ncbi:hypothetical protein CDD83_4946 [Cordyceps sp. RAO-2017]|nr:hypothetical protein CDD83_4946 [Cordyceps sp. RAO-2017]